MQEANISKVALYKFDKIRTKNIINIKLFFWLLLIFSFKFLLCLIQPKKGQKAEKK